MEKNIVLSDENFKQVYKKIVNMAFALINSNSSLKLFIEEKPSIKADIEKIILEVLADYKKNRIPIKIAEENKKFIKVANPVLGPAAQAAGATLPAAGAATGTGAAAGGAGAYGTTPCLGRGAVASAEQEHRRGEQGDHQDCATAGGFSRRISPVGAAPTRHACWRSIAGVIGW